MSKIRKMTAAFVAAVIFFLFWTLPGRPRAARWNGNPALAERLIPGAYHVHTSRSDGAGGRQEVAAAAARAGLKFVILTDHGDGTRIPVAPEYVQGVLCVDAVEVSTNGGHYTALGLGPAPYPLGGEAAAVIEDVTRLGGFGFAAHVDSPRPDLAWTDWTLPFDGVEWLNADSEWRDEPRSRVPRILFDYALRPGPALASILDRPSATLARWDSVAARRHVVAIAGHDAHGGVGRTTEGGKRAAMAGVPSYEASFRSFSVRVRLAEPLTGSASADAARILDAIRGGNFFTAIDAIAGPPLLDFHVSRGDAIVPMGGVLSPGPATFFAEAAMPAGARTILIHDGVEVASADSGPLRFEDNGARGAYRVEVRVPGAPGNPPIPWIVSNPIYFLDRPAAATPESRTPLEPLPDDLVWHAEHDARSAASVAAAGRRATLDFRLAPGERSSQFAALVADLRSRGAGFTALSFTASAAKPMRVSVQLRYAESGGERWRKSAYVDTMPREIELAVADLLPADHQTGPAPDPARATALLFVVDLTNAVPGDASVLRISNLAVRR